MDRINRYILLLRSHTTDDRAAREMIASTLAGDPRNGATDTGGHQRAHYGPLIVRVAAHLIPTVANLDRWYEYFRNDLFQHASTEGPLPACDGAQVCLRAWQALAVWTVDRARGAPSSHSTKLLDGLIKRQTLSGTLLTPARSDNPETWWYHELVLLHALASYAIESDDPGALRAVERAAVFHLNETQPDHATSQPWGLHAFALFQETSILVDQMLHAASILRTGGGDTVSFVLLTDALYSLEQLKRRTP